MQTVTKAGGSWIVRDADEAYTHQSISHVFQHVDEDMMSAANSEDGLPPGRPDASKVRAR
jgi:hypothetical protein